MDPKIEELIAASRFLHRISQPMAGFTSDYELYSIRLDNAIKAFEEDEDKEPMYKIEELLEAAKKVLNPPSRLRKAIRALEEDEDRKLIYKIDEQLVEASSMSDPYIITQLNFDFRSLELLREAIRALRIERNLT